MDVDHKELMQQAVSASRGGQYETAANLFYQLYEKTQKDKDITNACVMLWNGVNGCCRSSAMAFVCGMGGISNASYATDLFISCLFKLKQSNYTTSISDKIIELLEREAKILRYLVNEKKSTYAMPWLASLLRCTAQYDECSNLIASNLGNQTLPQSVVEQLQGCRNNIERYRRDSDEVCKYVIKAFPTMDFIDNQGIIRLHDICMHIYIG